MRLGRPGLHTFASTLHARAEVRGTLEDVYAIVCDPAFVGSSTPFVRRVVVLAEDRWRWELAGIRYPGGTFSAGMTQRMVFDPPRQVTFAHDPALDADRTPERELAGADGVFRLTPLEDDEGPVGRVRLDLEVHVHARVLAPKAAASVVEAAMHAVLVIMRDRFVRELERRLR